MAAGKNNYTTPKVASALLEATFCHMHEWIKELLRTRRYVEEATQLSRVLADSPAFHVLNSLPPWLRSKVESGPTELDIPEEDQSRILDLTNEKPDILRKLKKSVETHDNLTAKQNTESEKARKLLNKINSANVFSGKEAQLSGEDNTPISDEDQSRVLDLTNIDPDEPVSMEKALEVLKILGEAFPADPAGELGESLDSYLNGLLLTWNQRRIDSQIGGNLRGDVPTIYEAILAELKALNKKLDSNSSGTGKGPDRDLAQLQNENSNTKFNVTVSETYNTGGRPSDKTYDDAFRDLINGIEEVELNLSIKDIENYDGVFLYVCQKKGIDKPKSKDRKAFDKAMKRRLEKFLKGK